MKPLQRYLIALAVALATVMAAPSPAQAMVRSDTTFARTAPAWVARLHPYVYTRPGWKTWHLHTLPASVRAAVGSAQISRVQQSFRLVAEYGGMYGITMTTVDAEHEAQCAPNVCEDTPHIKLYLRWFGWRIWMDSYMLNRIYAGLMTAAGIAGAIAAIPNPVAKWSGVVGAALFFQAQYLWLCRNSKTGNANLYIVHMLYLTGQYSVVCNVFS